MQTGTAGLKLNAFEHFMWADDRPETPMTFYLRLRLGGVLQRQVFEQAVARALAAHPLLTSVAKGHPSLRGRKLSWQSLGDKASPHIEWIEGEQPFPLPPGGVGIDIRKEIGVRFFVRLAPTRTTILLQLHHAAVDARGGSRFLEDVLAHYHGLKRGEDSALWLRPLSPDRLASRAAFGLTKKQYRGRRSLDLRRIAKYFASQPEILSCKRPKSGRTIASGIATSLDIAVKDSDFDKLKSYAQEKGVTINDVLLRDLFITLDKWNARYLDKRGAKVIRLAMPIDMRREADVDMPAANVVSMCFLDRRPAEMIDANALLQSIHQETMEIKKNDLGMALIRAVGWFSKVRGGFRLLLQPNRFFPCHSTAVLSNLGQPLAGSNLPRRDGEIVVDNAPVLSLELMPPYRPNTPLAVGVGTVGSSLHIAMHYNAEALNLTQANELRSLFERQLKTTLHWKPEVVTEIVPILSPVASGGPLWSLPIGKNVRPKADESPSFL